MHVECTMLLSIDNYIINHIRQVYFRNQHNKTMRIGAWRGDTSSLSSRDTRGSYGIMLCRISMMLKC